MLWPLSLMTQTLPPSLFPRPSTSANWIPRGSNTLLSQDILSLLFLILPKICKGLIAHFPLVCTSIQPTGENPPTASYKVQARN